jgi:ATP-binding cassette subfamily B protein
MLSNDDVLALGPHISVQFYRQDEPVFRAGDSGDAFYIIHSGSANVIAELGDAGRQTVAVLRRGAGFGEQALLLETPRTHTVEAAETLCVLKLPADQFRQFLKLRPDLKKSMTMAAQRLLELNFLRTVGALAVLRPAQVEDVLEQIEQRKFVAGEMILREGEPSNECHMVTRGTVRFSGKGRETETQIAGPGATLGVVSLIEKTHHKEEVRAESDCSTIVLRREAIAEALRDGGAERMLREFAIGHLLGAGFQAFHNAVPTARITYRYERVRSGAFAGRHAVATTDAPALAALACLATIRAKHSGDASAAFQWPPSELVLQRLQQTKPDTIYGIAVVAENEGYLARVTQLVWPDLSAVCPLIAEYGDGLVAVLSCTADAVLLADPLSGLKELDRREFVSNWNGRALLLEPVEEGATNVTGVSSWLWHVTRPRRRSLATAVAFGAAGLVFGLAAPLSAKWLIDNVLVTSDLSLFWVLVAVSGGAVVFHAAFLVCRDLFWSDSVGRATYVEETRFLRRILSLPSRGQAEWSSSDFTETFHWLSSLLQAVSIYGLRACFDAASIVLAMTVIPFFSVRLALIVLVCLSGYAYLLWSSSRRLRPTRQAAFDAHRDLVRLVLESVSGILQIKCLTAENGILAHADRLIGRWKTNGKKVAGGEDRTTAISTFLSEAATIAILGYGAALVLRGQLTAGSLLATVGLFAGMLAPMASVVEAWRQSAVARGPVAQVRYLECQARPTETGRVAAELRGHTEFRNVRFRYPGAQTDTLRGISFSVMPGKKVAIVGRSGSGKTTLMNLLAGLYKPSEGTILLDGSDIRNLHPTTLKQIGAVEQDAMLFSGTLRANIAISEPDASIERVIAAARLAGAHDFILALPRGYDTPVAELGGALSRGQAQRIALARTILARPRVLLLDEATASLDLETARVVQANLDSAFAGKTMFVVAHRLATIRKADVIIVLDCGRIVESGTHSELMALRGFYHYLNVGAA